MTDSRNILLIVSGGIAAYKALDLIRRLSERQIGVRCVLTAAGSKFVTPLSLSALTGKKVYSDLFSLTDEQEMGHIRLSREADLVVVAPATANLIAKAANGIGDDLASTVLLATNKPVLFVPSMNARMWQHPATQRNLRQLVDNGTQFLPPSDGDLACGEVGPGRMAETSEILDSIESLLGYKERALVDVNALVTSGPTFEPIDPVRYIGNHSSGKQGHAIAQALVEYGAQVTLVTGPTHEPDPPGAAIVRITTAREMMEACLNCLPVDLAVCAAAVGDWRIGVTAKEKIKREGSSKTLELVENEDILRRISLPNRNRPQLVVGFAAETENVVENAGNKRIAKGCDWIVANDVSDETKVFGGTDNKVHLIDGSGVEQWPMISKHAVANRLAEKIVSHLRRDKRL
ncbi:MAG: bifunctional phosphopantothenoylcysteine decarboxylase/phosphopantothenate--cysteine ligase CoaBC [Pseudomonadota bacterium]|nr:bifunctional phosphopantothenoylcysteine decarboxylase/phosphopantothenate--cysteine ligase CoaBC [Pseudomonadota bacterium]